MRRSIVLTGSLLLLPALIQAQGRGGGAMSGGGARSVGVSRSVAAAPRVGTASHMASSGGSVRVMTSTGIRTVPSGSLVRVRTANGTVRILQRRIVHTTATANGVRFSGQNNFDVNDVNGVPGLGFDYVHFAATHPNARFRHSRTIGGFFPFFDGGFALPASPVVVEDTPVDTVDGNGNEIVEEVPMQRRIVRSMPMEEPAPVAQSAPEPVRDSSEYVFVRRDGTVFFAVAYSWDQNTLKYVTNQGVRGSVTREALDLSATQKFNEQRGMSFTAPA
jgi:hypothetical protein